jgi:hypothetical protein
MMISGNDNKKNKLDSTSRRESYSLIEVTNKQKNSHDVMLIAWEFNRG